MQTGLVLAYVVAQAAGLTLDEARRIAGAKSSVDESLRTWLQQRP
jgi:hypothetical protein